jgi:hypothetical protein
MAQDAMAVFAHGRARRLHHDAFGKEDRLVGQNERALSLQGEIARWTPIIKAANIKGE